jgi:hypothetical protein
MIAARASTHVPLASVLAAALVSSVLAGCRTAPVEAADGSGALRTVEGAIVRVDRSPMAWDGHGLLVIATAQGEVTVNVPARTNLCQATGLDLFASVEAGTRVQAAGSPSGPAAVTVCSGADHYLRQVD